METRTEHFVARAKYATLLPSSRGWPMGLPRENWLEAGRSGGAAKCERRTTSQPTFASNLAHQLANHHGFERGDERRKGVYALSSQSSHGGKAMVGHKRRLQPPDPLAYLLRHSCTCFVIEEQAAWPSSRYLSARKLRPFHALIPIEIRTTASLLTVTSWQQLDLGP